MTKPSLYVVRKRPPIPDGITCHTCGHERPPHMKTCPKCEDTAIRDLDTSTKALLRQGATIHKLAILTWAVMQLRGAA